MGNERPVFFKGYKGYIIFNSKKLTYAHFWEVGGVNGNPQRGSFKVRATSDNLDSSGRFDWNSDIRVGDEGRIQLGFSEDKELSTQIKIVKKSLSVDVSDLASVVYEFEIEGELEIPINCISTA